MSIYEGEGCQKLVMMQRDFKRRRKDQMKIYDQIFREEIIVQCFWTNIIFFFAGNATVNMPRQLTNLLWVVLALRAHS